MTFGKSRVLYGLKMASTLYEYYGGKLPSLSQRASVYKGYGFSDPYTGSARQNVNLLAKLKGGGGGVPVGTVITPKDPYTSALESYQDYYRKAETPEAIIRRIMGEQGVPELQSTLSTISGNLARQEGLLDKLEPDINERTAGFDVRESQRRQLLAKESEPIIDAIADLVRSKEVTQGDLQSKLNLVTSLSGAAERGIEQGSIPFQLALSAAQEDRDFQRQKELTRLSKSGSGGGSSALDALATAILGTGKAQAAGASGVPSDYAGLGLSDLVSKLGTELEGMSTTNRVKKLRDLGFNRDQVRDIMMGITNEGVGWLANLKNSPALNLGDIIRRNTTWDY